MPLKGFGYQEKIQIGAREFHIHTGCDINKNLSLSEIFEEGRFLYSTSNHYKLRKENQEAIDDEYVKSKTKTLHDEIVDEISLLFLVNDKIKTVRNHLPHYRLAKVFCSKNLFKDAIENLKMAIEIKPDFTRAYRRLGLIYLKKKHYEPALNIYKKALQVNPDYPDILNCLGVVYTQLGKYELAKDFLQQAIRIKSNFIEANFNLGIVLFLSTLVESSEEENIVLPARVVRALKKIRERKNYQDKFWRESFTHVIEILNDGKKRDVFNALSEIQFKIATREDDSSAIMDFFFLKFMYGGRVLSKEEMEYYERQIRTQVKKQVVFADYWNELGVIHLIQCREYFLKALGDLDKSVNINPNYKEAKNSLNLLKNNKKGFLILLRAILK